MRLVLVVPRFPRLSETFIANKFVGLVDDGWDVHVVCQESAVADWDKLPSLAGRLALRRRVHAQWQHEPHWVVILLWLPVFLLTLLRAPGATVRYWRVVGPEFGAATLKQFYMDAAIIALQPAILHYEFGALAVDKLYLKRALGCRLSVSFRGYDLNYVGLDDPDYYGQLWATVDAIHLLGHDLRRRALRRGCPPDKPYALIPPAIDVGFFAPADGARQPATIGPDRPLRILSVGRLEWKKGYEYALSAVRLLGERGVPFEYHIVGDGSFLESLAFARYELGLEDRVTFRGAQPHPAVLERMKWADVFLHPAVSEGFCNAVIEAQAMRLPVVAADADGLAENVADGETGFVVARRDAAALADKLALLAGDPALRRRIGAAGRARVENCFSLPQQIAAFDRFYREGVTGHAH
ncbi:MAG: glycosyltransferase [Candidatus Promineofilum sp.]|nr:glycosyltransferase [Promineifilum sp.]